MNEETTTAQGLSRRTLAKGAAWTVPAIGLAAAAPMVAASPLACPDPACLQTNWALPSFTATGVEIQAGAFNIPPWSTTGTTVTVEGITVSVSSACSSFWGSLFGAWGFLVTAMSINTTDSGQFTYNFPIAVPTIGSGLSPLALTPVGGAIGSFPSYPWGKQGDGLLTFGQTDAHHITSISLNVNFLYISLIDSTQTITCPTKLTMTTENLILDWNAGTVSTGTFSNI